MSKFLVTGATGAVGPSVVAALQAAGHSVRILAHRTPGTAAPGVEVAQGDITDRPSLVAAAQGVDGVVHMAALLHIVNPDAALHRQYEAINVDGTANVVAAALAADVRRLVFFSTIAVYGPTQGRMLDETSPPAPDTIYGRTKLAAERIVLAARRDDGAPLGTVLRLAAVYGGRIKGNYRNLLLSLSRGRFLPIGAGQNQRTLVYEQDVANATALAVAHADAGGRLYNVTDGQTHTMQEILAAMCAALGRQVPAQSLPVGPMRMLAGLAEDGAGLLGRKAPIGRATIDKYVEDVRVDGSRIQRELGFRPQYDLNRGWRETVAALQQASAGTGSSPNAV